MVGLVGLFALSTSTGNAGVTDEIIEGIEDGSRTIREEVVSLKQIPVPSPSNLSDFIVDENAALELGKALFWDMQIGSDGIQACASCHFNGGADSRVKNQLNPGSLRTNAMAAPTRIANSILGEARTANSRPRTIPSHQG